MCISSVQFSHSVWLFATPRTAARQASLSITNSGDLLKLMPIESVMPSNHLILCCPLLLPPSIFPSIRVFSSESVLRIRWPKYWSFSFNISPSNEHSGLISFRMDWLDLLAVQGTLKSLLQHHSSKASMLWCSAFFKYAHLSLIWGSNNVLLCYKSYVIWFLPKLVSHVSRWTAGNQNGFKKHKYKVVYYKSQYMNRNGVKVFIKLQILISNYVSLTYAFYHLF